MHMHALKLYSAVLKLDRSDDLWIDEALFAVTRAVMMSFREVRTSATPIIRLQYIERASLFPFPMSGWFLDGVTPFAHARVRAMVPQ